MYFAGDGIGSLTLEDRMTLTNMAIEAGGKNGVCDVDEKTLQYVPQPQQPARLGSLTRRPPTPNITSKHEWDLATLEPLVAKPHSPDNRTPPTTAGDVKLDRRYIGSCTGGKITDMIFAANLLKGNTVKIHTFVVPGSTEVHADMKRLNLRGACDKGANEKSIEEVLLDAGCEVGASGCGACLGGPPDTFGRLQQAPRSASAPPTATSPAAWAAPRSAVYLASPLTVAASALTGHVTDPREYVHEAIETGMAGVA